MTHPALDPAVAQARSVLARASGGHAQWLDPEVAARTSSLVTAIYLDHPRRELSDDRSPVVLEVSDPAPVPVRERIRSRVRLFGLGVTSHETTPGIHLRPSSVQLESGGSIVALDPADLWRTGPDPLALAEAGLLSHLVRHHPETTAQLARLLPDEIRTRARHISPVAIDRRGIVLRVEHSSGHSDVRLAFDQEITHACQAADAMAALATRADAPRTRAKESRQGNLFPSLLAAGPAAARICSSDSDTSDGDTSDTETPGNITS